MSERDRRNKLTTFITISGLVVLVFFVGWTTIKLRTEQRVTEHYARQAEASIRPEDVHLSCDGLASNAITECVIKKYEEHEKWGKDRRDLHAQEDMALWAMWMLIFTGLAFVALVGTLHYTRRAADYTEFLLAEAKATTAEAKSANKIAANSIQEANRPYLFVTPQRSNFIDWFHSETPFNWPMKISNHGNHPAIIHSVFIGCGIGDDFEGPIFNSHKCKLHKGLETGIDDWIVISAGDSFTTENDETMRVIHPDGSDMVIAKSLQNLANNHDVLYRIVISYEDAHGIKREHSAAFRQVYAGMSSGRAGG